MASDRGRATAKRGRRISSINLALRCPFCPKLYHINKIWPKQRVSMISPACLAHEAGQRSSNPLPRDAYNSKFAAPAARAGGPI
jgi:hypothetical protein